MKRFTWLWVPVAGLGLAAAGYGVMSRRAQPTSSEPGGATDSTSSAPLTSLRAMFGDEADAPCTFKTGHRLAFDVASTVDAQIDLKRYGLSGELPAQETKTTFTAVLEAEVLSPDEHPGAVLLGRWQHVNPETTRALGDLSAPFLMRVSNDCSLNGFARTKGTTLLVARAQQAALHQLWWRLPVAEQQTAEGHNSLGAFSAVLARASDDRGPLAQRRVTAYTRQWAPGAQKVDVANSLLTVRYGSGPWFDSMEGSEVLAGGITSKSTLSARARAPAENSLLDASRSPSAYEWEDLLPRSIATAARPGVSDEVRKQQQELANLDLEEAVTRFAAHVATEPNFDQRWVPMARYLEARPDAIPAFAEGLQQPGLPTELKMVGFMALGKANVPEARDALQVVRQNEAAEPYDRIRSAIALVGRDDVGIELARSLRKDALASDPASPLYARNSLLALGMLGGLRSGKDVAVEGEVRAGVMNALSRARTPVELSVVFGALGNLGDPTLLPEIDRWSKNPDPDIRAVVAQGLRRLSQRQVSAFELEWLRRETSPDVKESLYNVIYHQHLDWRTNISRELATQALQDLKAQPLILTRQSLVRLLGPVAAEYPDVEAALVEQVRHEVGTGSGLYSLISQYVPGEKVARVLKAMPELDGDSPGAGQPASTEPLTPPVSGTGGPEVTR